MKLIIKVPCEMVFKYDSSDGWMPVGIAHIGYCGYSEPMYPNQWANEDEGQKREVIKL